jgi:hypothetical protein
MSGGCPDLCQKISMYMSMRNFIEANLSYTQRERISGYRYSRTRLLKYDFKANRNFVNIRKELGGALTPPNPNDYPVYITP